MGRRRSGLDKNISLFAKLPWPVCLVLAVVSGIGLHLISKLTPRPSADIGEMPTIVLMTYASAIASVGRFVVPIVLVAAAVVSWHQKRHRLRLHDDALRSTGRSLQDLHWRDFEQLAGAWFEHRGYRVAFTPSGADGGIDVIATKPGEKVLVQCKQWRAMRVGVSVVREMYGLVVAHRATGGVIMSMGPFTPDAAAFADGKPITLVDATTVFGASRRDPTPPVRALPSPAVGAVAAPPACPRCGKPMVARTARKGADAGQSFYGCSAFPACRGTRPIAS